jgi:hypothetical protein
MFVRPGSFLAMVSAGIACWLEPQAAARIEYLIPKLARMTMKICSFMHSAGVTTHALTLPLDSANA